MWPRRNAGRAPSTVLFVLAILAGACRDFSGPSVASVPQHDWTPKLKGLLSRSAADLGQAVALWLQDADARQRLLQAIRSSEFREGKVSWNELVQREGQTLLPLLHRNDDQGAAATRAIHSVFPDLEVYFPIPAHRASWTGGENLLVTVWLGGDQPLEGWVAYDLRGKAVHLLADAPPAIPVLVLHRPEGFIPARAPLANQEYCPPEQDGCGGGGGGGGGDPPPITGYFMTSWAIDGAYDGPFGGLPEFEIFIYHWTGQCVPVNDCTNPGNQPVRDGDYRCASGDFPSGDLHDWYYNDPPNAHSGEVMLLDSYEALTFPSWAPSADRTMLLVTENDDGPGCYPEHAFPTAWGSSELNSDDYIGQALITDLNSHGDVGFFGYDYQAHAIMSFLRRN